MKMASELKLRTVYLLKRTDKPGDGTDIYVGSTSLSLGRRLQIHRAAVGIQRLYTRVQEVGKYNWGIIPLLTRACDQKAIREFERKWVETLNPDLNTISPLSNNYTIRCRQADKELYHRNIQNKAYYCNICNKSFGCKAKLQTHLNSLKHSYVYLNSLD